jgi:hypothetical protein
VPERYFAPLRLIDLIASGGSRDFSAIALSCASISVRAG